MERTVSTALCLWALTMVACGDDSASGGAGGGAAGGAGAGGGASPSGCTADPFACPAGQTCWIDENQMTFSCLNSGPGDPGDSCVNIAGQPTCGDGHACLQLAGASNGVCTPYCDPEDPAHACPDNAECLSVELAGALFRVCEPAGMGGGGMGGGGGAGGSGGG